MVGEELGVLPGMDSIFTMLELERLVGFFRQATRKNHKGKPFDVVIYDGVSTEETLRMIGLSSKTRSHYLFFFFVPDFSVFLSLLATLTKYMACLADCM